jgi:hypothetical protein
MYEDVIRIGPVYYALGPLTPLTSSANSGDKDLRKNASVNITSVAACP